MPHREGLRTWIEIHRDAVQRNIRTFRRLIGPNVKLWSVVKSNAYGHGLYAFTPLAEQAGVDGFCVDSVVEGLSLRRAGVKKPILTLGPTLPPRLIPARKSDIAVSIPTFEALHAISGVKDPPKFHLKIDTGMHRQGFYLHDVPKVVKALTKLRISKSKQLEGVFTHFASAKDLNYPTYTDMQFAQFEKAVAMLRKAGFRRLIRHAAATGGTLIGKNYHLDAVRVGIGLYGLWPSKELEVQLGSRIRLAPALSWRTAVAEVKRLMPGDYVGYDLTERVRRPTVAAVLPIGYWHGFPRSLSSVGEVLIRGKRARVLGRVSMAMIVVDATDARPRVGDTAIVIGKNGRDELSAADVAARAGTIHYELVTQLNPLMERVVV
ncbi:MAG: alanine racemase [Candidatus Parcubacteria bacterium]|jgi:alanine racemase